MRRTTAPRQRKVAGLSALFLGCFQLLAACGGMTTEDASAGSGGSDGGVSSGGTTTAGGTTGAGGAVVGIGGTDAETGGTDPGAGGASPGTGGSSEGTGGASDGTGGTVSQTACSADYECVVVPTGCCSSCEPVLAESVQAVNYNWYFEQPGCEVLCGACYEVPEVDRTRDYFVGQCQDGQCTLVDIREDYASCNTGEDCILHNGSNCCEECDESGFIAVSSFEFLGDRCDNVGACLPCEPIGVVGLSAQCNLDTHRCEKVQE